MKNNVQRDFAKQVVRELRSAGHESLWAGGCVRDELLGREPQDYDVATSATPDQVRELFGRKRTLAIGAAFGVISVLGGKEREPIEVATFRSDGAYVDGRHPSSVTFTSAEEDAQRRDFTINGLFFDPLEGRLIDYVGGEQDLRAGIVRAIGEPAARFGEDKLRMLRAVRFATTFEFALDSATAEAIRTMAEQVDVVSAERIGVELRKILQHRQRGRGVRLLAETGLWQPLFPTLKDWPLEGQAGWAQTLVRLDALTSDRVPVAFAALLVGVDVEVVRELGRSFRFTNKEIDRATWLVETLPSVEQADSLAWPRLQRVLVHEGTDELMQLATAEWGEDHQGVRTCRERLAWPREKLNPVPLLSGDDLVAAGMQPGKHFGQLLERLRDEQLEGRLADRQQALAWAETWVREHVKN